MTVFEIRQCTSQVCRLRVPLDPEIYSGDYCPRCGAPMVCVVQAYQNKQGGGDSTTHTRPFEVVLDNVRSAHNVGSIFRTADGVGVRRIYLCGITPDPDKDPSIQKTALGADAKIEWSTHPNALDLVRDLHEKQYHLLALERRVNSTEIDQYRPLWADERPAVLIVGNERAGVDPGLLGFCEAVLSLPMLGRKASLNVAVAFGAAAYQLLFIGVE